MQTLKFHIVSVLLAGMLFSCSNPSTGWADKALKRAEKQALAMAVQLDTLPGRLPRSATPEGELIAQVPGDIDVSDVEILYAQQHGHTGYIEQNDFDTAMNDEPDGIQEDISLT